MDDTHSTLSTDNASSSVGDLDETFRQNMRFRRIDLGLSQAGLAKKLGYSAGLIGRMERGKTAVSLNQVELIADALDWRVVDLLGIQGRAVFDPGPPAEDLDGLSELMVRVDHLERETGVNQGD